MVVVSQGCSSVQAAEDSPHGVVIFSTSLIPGCEESDYFDNGIIYADNKLEAGVDFNIPIGHVGSGARFVVKNVFRGVDFAKSGRVHSYESEPGTYYFTKMRATPRSFVHHETDMLGMRFDVVPGKVIYLGSIELGTIECAAQDAKPNIGSRTIVSVKDESERDLGIVKKRWSGMPSHLVVKMPLALEWLG